MSEEYIISSGERSSGKSIALVRIVAQHIREGETVVMSGPNALSARQTNLIRTCSQEEYLKIIGQILEGDLAF